MLYCGGRNSGLLIKVVVSAVTAAFFTGSLISCGALKKAKESKETGVAEESSKESEISASSPSSPPHSSVSPSQRSHFDTINGNKVLIVDDEPFLVLACQPDAWVMDKASDAAARQFKHAKDLSCNTMEIQIKWKHVEPEKDRYSTEFVKWVIERARENGLKLVLLWFGSNCVGKTDSTDDLQIVPEYISSDTKSYSRLGRFGFSFMPKNVLDPSDPDTLEREGKAYRKILEFVRDYDTEGRVIMWQVLNEVGVYPEVKIPYPEAELTRHLARYVETLAKIEKEVHGIPAFTNFWEGLKGPDLNVFLSSCPSLDFISPDLYGKPGSFHLGEGDYNDFRKGFLDALGRYSKGRNIFFVSETNTDVYYRSDLTLFHTIGKVPGLGIDVWAITTGSMRGHDPLVDPKTGKLMEGGVRLKEAYEAVSKAMTPVATYQGTANFAYSVLEEGGKVIHKVGKFEVEVNASPEGAVILVSPSENELVVIGRMVEIGIKGISQKTGKVTKGRWV